MPECVECKNFFPREEEPGKGDCVQRVVDPRQAFTKSKPTDAGHDAGKCESFVKK